MHRMSKDPARRGPSTPSRRRCGRELTYRSKALRIGRSNPCSETESGTRGPAHRTKIDGVERAQLLNAVIRHHAAVLEIVIAGPGEGLALQSEAKPLRCRGQD